MVFRSESKDRRTGLMLAGVALLAFAVGFMAVLFSHGRDSAPQIIAIEMPAAPKALDEPFEDAVAVEGDDAVEGEVEPELSAELVPEPDAAEEASSQKRIAKRSSATNEGTISELETLNPF